MFISLGFAQVYSRIPNSGPEDIPFTCGDMLLLWHNSGSQGKSFKNDFPSLP